MALPAAPDLPIDPIADRLILLYEAAERDLDRIITAAANRGAEGTARYYTNQQARVVSILRQLRRRTAPLRAALVPSAYRTGVSAVDRVLEAEKAFSGVHTAAEEVIAANLEGHLRYAEEFIGRRTQDALRKAALEAVGVQIAAGVDPRGQAKQFEEKLRRDGLTAFVDRRGRRWRLGVYAAMVTRTTTREAVSVGMKNRLIEHGKTLVEISEHRGSCAICLPYQGKTFSITPDDTSYPLLEELPPFHPNCRHVLLPATVSFEQMEAALGLGPDPTPPEVVAATEGDEVLEAIVEFEAKREADTPPRRGIRDAVTVATRDGFVKEEAEAAMRAIERVHGFGEKPAPTERDPLRWGVRVMMNNRIKAEGQFAPLDPRENAMRIELNRNVTRRHLGGGRFALLHELGHAIDHMLGPGLGRYASQEGRAEAAKVLDAIRSTPTYDRIRSDPQISRRLRLYLTDPAELFARAYSEWIARRSGDPFALEAVEREAASRVPWQWPNAEEFEPIARAFDELMEDLGWRIS